MGVWLLRLCQLCVACTGGVWGHANSCSPHVGPLLRVVSLADAVLCSVSCAAWTCLDLPGPSFTAAPLYRGWYCEIPLISEGVYMQIEQAEQMMNG